VLVTNRKSVNNAVGARSLGPNVTVRVGDSTITGNNTGLSFSGGSALLTYGTNKLQANGGDGADGAFSGPVRAAIVTTERQRDLPKATSFVLLAF
jgi:hypothetical protein